MTKIYRLEVGEFPGDRDMQTLYLSLTEQEKETLQILLSKLTPKNQIPDPLLKGNRQGWFDLSQ